MAKTRWSKYGRRTWQILGDEGSNGEVETLYSDAIQVARGGDAGAGTRFAALIAQKPSRLQADKRVARIKEVA